MFGLARGTSRFTSFVVALAACCLACAVTPALAAAAGPVRWSVGKRIDRASTLVGVSCPASNLCFALDSADRVLISKDPTAGARSRWARERVPGGGTGTAIDCPTSSFCVVLDSSGIHTSTDPLAGSSAHWQQVSPGSQYGLTAISCVRRALCMAVGDESEGIGPTAEVALSSTDPAAGASAKWTLSATLGIEAALLGVSCPSTSFCITLDPAQAYTTVDPTKGASASWTTIRVSSDPNSNFDAVSCRSDGLCVAVGQGGSGKPAVATSTDPTKQSKARWKDTTVKDAGQNFAAVSCGAVTFCAAVGDRAASTTAPTKASTWTPDNRVDGVSVSCAGATSCAVVDQEGYFFSATRHR